MIFDGRTTRSRPIRGGERRRQAMFFSAFRPEMRSGYIKGYVGSESPETGSEPRRVITRKNSAKSSRRNLEARRVLQMIRIVFVLAPEN